MSFVCGLIYDSVTLCVNIPSKIGKDVEGNCRDRHRPGGTKETHQKSVNGTSEVPKFNLGTPEYTKRMKTGQP